LAQVLAPCAFRAVGAAAMLGQMGAPPQAEWPGAVSGKFTDTISGRPFGKCPIATNCRNGDETSLSRNGLAKFFTDTAGLKNSESKRIVGQPGSDVFVWRPCKRALSAPGGDHYVKPEGKRGVEPPPGKPVCIRERQHIRMVESKEEYSDRPIGLKTIRHENGLRAADQPAREVDITGECQRKARPSDLLGQRNGLGCRSLGDKPYKHPEYSSQFHMAGGLVVGATFSRGGYKKTESRSSASVQLIAGDTASRAPVRSYEDKQRERLALEARSEVEDLTRNWENSTLKECDAKYEEPLDSDDEVHARAPAA